MSALKKQIGGDHYKGFPYQPVEFYHKTDLQGTLCLAVRYLIRDKKDKKEDLQKAKHCISLYKEICLKHPEKIRSTDFITMMDESSDFIEKNKLPDDIADVFNLLCSLSMFRDENKIIEYCNFTITGINYLLNK